MSSEPRDFMLSGVVSDCCGARVLAGEMCADCKEHCQSVNEYDEEPDTTAPKPLTPLENWQRNDEHNL